eukprot:SAG22_NODE_954_length_6332_cov_4.111343_3_plen_462_part_00
MSAARGRPHRAIRVLCSALLLSAASAAGATAATDDKEAAPFACSSDADCQLNGVCRSARCDCDAAWQGDDCGRLAFDGDSELAYGGPQSGVSSWGGGPPVFDAATKEYVLFVTEIAHHCGLDQWQHLSTVVAASAASPAGPFVRRPGKPAITAQAHNPYYAYDARSKTHLIYHIGTGSGAVYNSSLHCTNGTTPASDGQKPSARPGEPVLESGLEYSEQPNLHAAKSLARPFVKVNFSLPPGHTAAGWGNDNPAPFVFPNGSVLMLSRKYNGTAAKLKIVPHDTIWLVRADSYRGPYELVHDRPLFSDWFAAHGPFNEEDPCIWRDSRGNFHALFHFTRGHAWSADGLTWSWGGSTRGHPRPAFEANVRGLECGAHACHAAPGHVQTLEDAERPRIWVNASSGMAELFFVASGGNGQPSKPGLGARGFTVVRKLRTAKPAAPAAAAPAVAPALSLGELPGY